MAYGSTPDSLSVLGVPLSLFTSYGDAVDQIVARVKRREKTFCVAINPEKVYRAQSDEGLRELLCQADLHLCDGVGVAIAARLLHGRRIVRITGIQLFLNLMRAAEQHGLGVFLLGGSVESNLGVCRRLREKHPRLRIVGNQDGYFQDDRAVVRRVNQSRADMLFVGLGSPKQEQWIAEHRQEIPTPFCMGVGGTFDVVSGRASWAPPVCRKTGTEFLFRLIREPGRWRRQLCLPGFLCQVIRQALVGKPAEQPPAELPVASESAPASPSRKAA